MHPSLFRSAHTFVVVQFTKHFPFYLPINQLPHKNVARKQCLNNTNIIKDKNNCSHRQYNYNISVGIGDCKNSKSWLLLPIQAEFQFFYKKILFWSYLRSELSTLTADTLFRPWCESSLFNLKVGLRLNCSIRVLVKVDSIILFTLSKHKTGIMFCWLLDCPWLLRNYSFKFISFKRCRNIDTISKNPGIMGCWINTIYLCEVIQF